MGAYDLMPRKKAAVYHSSETLGTSSSDSSTSSRGSGSSSKSSTCSSSHPLPGCSNPGSLLDCGRSDPHINGQPVPHMTCNNDRNDGKGRTNGHHDELGTRYRPKAGKLKFEPQMLERLSTNVAVSVSDDRLNLLSNMGFCTNERSKSGDIYSKPSPQRYRDMRRLLPGQLRPYHSSDVRFASVLAASNSSHQFCTISSNSLFKSNTGLQGSLLSHLRMAALKYSRSSQLFMSDESEIVDDGYPGKRYRSSPDSFESGDLRHGKRFLHGLESRSKDVNLSEEDVTLSNVFQVSKN
ncbi:hypothetical protein PoB_006351600 [Plakobranchus ocellatus]|uniref:Uncharacterized protein n=1 Tax=Plakobranchus ocellatus TaxID=259542 RepID=A0AAV4CYW7_9GAST|nr:hypothetical protein PoB_006351600 [Plakobranchus ocellatus]